MSMEGMIHATWRVEGSKISGVELPLEVHCTQDKIQINGVLRFQNTHTEFLYLIKFKCINTWRETPFI